MILLKAIGKTLLSILKWILIIVVYIGVLLGALYLCKFPSITNKIGIVIVGILVVAAIIGIIFCIVETTKDNYEKYARQSKTPINTYHIQYYKIYEDYDDVEGKTKKQAINSLYRKLAEVETDDSHIYKIDKITKIN